MYGVVGYKTHAKMTLIVRREGEGIRRYCHLGTGNYHPSTARLYTDYGLFTCDEDIGNDVHEIFLQLTSLTRHREAAAAAAIAVQSARVAAGNDRARERPRARRQAGAHHRQAQRAGGTADHRDAVPRHRSAGVRIDLIVRGVCALRPGLPGVSENIRVRSIVGRFLEHSRVYWFENDGDRELYLASADWMERNFFRRVEIAFPVLRKPKCATASPRISRLYLADNTNAWELRRDGTYARVAAARLRQRCAGTVARHCATPSRLVRPPE